MGVVSSSCCCIGVAEDASASASPLSRRASTFSLTGEEEKAIGVSANPPCCREELPQPPPYRIDAAASESLRSPLTPSCVFVTAASGLQQHPDDGTLLLPARTQTTMPTVTSASASSSAITRKVAPPKPRRNLNGAVFTSTIGPSTTDVQQAYYTRLITTREETFSSTTACESTAVSEIIPAAHHWNMMPPLPSSLLASLTVDEEELSEHRVDTDSDEEEHEEEGMGISLRVPPLTLPAMVPFIFTANATASLPGGGPSHNTSVNGRGFASSPSCSGSSAPSKKPLTPHRFSTSIATAISPWADTLNVLVSPSRRTSGGPLSPTVVSPLAADGRPRRITFVSEEPLPAARLDASASELFAFPDPHVTERETITMHSPPQEEDAFAVMSTGDGERMPSGSVNTSLCGTHTMMPDNMQLTQIAVESGSLSMSNPSTHRSQLAQKKILSPHSNMILVPPTTGTSVPSVALLGTHTASRLSL